MMRRITPSLRKAFVGLLLSATILVALGLARDTVGLAQQAVMPADQPTPTTAPEATPSPRAPTRSAVRPTPTTAPAEPTAEPKITGLHPKSGRYISAWLPNSFGSVNRESFEANADILDEISPFWYHPDSNGNLYFGREARDQTLIELAHSKGVLVIPSVHNVINGTDPVPALMRNPEARSRHVRIIVDEVVKYNYDGIDIDYEFLPANLRDGFSAFIVELSDALHAQNKLLTIAVHAKTEDYGGLGGFQDWVVIGKAVDRLRIMTYDYHWRGGGPGPVAPLYWVEDVAEYAKTVVDPAKIVIGVPFYGYNWPSGGGNAVGQTWDMINEIIQTNGLAVNLMERNDRGLVQENWITYGGRQVWFSTGSGLAAKLDLVQRYDLAGIAIWRLGGEDPNNWTVIRNKLAQDPFESQRMVNQVLPEH
jgi:spore germination protein YaaH